MKMAWSITEHTGTDTKYVVNIVNKDYMFRVNGLNYNSVKMKIRFICQANFAEKNNMNARHGTARRYINLCICINHYYFIVILTHSLSFSLCIQSLSGLLLFDSKFQHSKAYNVIHCAVPRMRECRLMRKLNE